MTSWQFFLQMLRRRRTSWLVYTLTGFGLLILYIGLFPSIQQQQATYNQLVNSLPKAILDAFNITQSSNSLMSYLVAKHFGLVWVLMLIFMVISFSGAAVADEVEHRTMGLVLALPISRQRVYWLRVLAILAAMTSFVVLSGLAAWPLAPLFGLHMSFIDALNVSVLGECFGLAFLGLGMMVSALMSEAGRVFAVMSGVLLVMYVLNIIATLENKLSGLKYGSLFHYYVPGSVIDGGHLDLTAVLVLLGVGAIGLAAGAVTFGRRDVSV